ncbi:prominin-1-A-like [Genypterus blacodes]|uniref:prominin-1-A-like n=1 Tax=Genypterus blacodes TaxID=154954 RepID=UPI003F772468
MLWTSWLVLLLCWGGTSGGKSPEVNRPQTPYPPRAVPMEFGFVPATVYDTHAYYEPGAMGVLFHMVHAFLYVVQPNPVPKDLIVQVIKQNMTDVKQLKKDWRKPENIILWLQWMHYETGFIICAAVGFGFVLLLPIVGMCVCACRCCENCGGEMHQRQSNKAVCQRSFYTTCLVATTVFIITGIIVAHAANQNITTQIKSTRRLVTSNFRDLKTFANSTPGQIDYLIEQFAAAKEKAVSDLDNIVPLLGVRIQSQMERQLFPPLKSTLDTSEAIIRTKKAMSTSVLILRKIDAAEAELAAELNVVIKSLNAYNNLQIPNITKESKKAELPDFTPFLESIDKLPIADISVMIKKAYSSFDETPTQIKAHSQAIVQEVKARLDDVSKVLRDGVKGLALQSATDKVCTSLNEIQHSIESLYPLMDQIDFYRWIGCLAVLCAVVLIVAFSLLGLLCGASGFKPQATPTSRGCMSNTGGNLLLAGVGFSFMFAWLLMAIVTSLLFVGGNVEKLLCEPMANRQIYKCHENNGLYQALKLEAIFDLNAFVDISAFKKEMAKVFENVAVNVPKVEILDAKTKESLQNFEMKISLTGYLLQSKTEFKHTLEKITKHVKHYTAAAHVDHQTDLKILVGQLEAIQSGTLETQLKHLGIINRTLTAINSVEDFISHSTPEVVKEETKVYMEDIAGYFLQYIDWARSALELEVAPCKPISNILDSMEIVACSFLLDSVNTYWLGLGFSTVFLIPSIFFSMKLSKFYRRMDTEDVLDE